MKSITPKVIVNWMKAPAQSNVISTSKPDMMKTMASENRDGMSKTKGKVVGCSSCNR